MRSPMPPNQQKSASSFGPAMIFAFVLIMCLALTMGYLVTKHIIYPFILKQDISNSENIPTSGGIVVDDNEIPNASPDGTSDSITTDGPHKDSSSGAEVSSAGTDVSGDDANSLRTTDPQTASSQGGTGTLAYCVQLANLSTKQAADKMAAELKSKGITCSVMEINGTFKVLGESYSSKDEARSHLLAISMIVPDAFVTSISAN